MIELRNDMLFKFLGPEGRCAHGGSGSWPLPQNGRPGEWMPWIENLELCVSGYHVLRKQNLLFWPAETLWTIETRGSVVVARDKLVVNQARLLMLVLTWNKEIARLFACDCAEHVLPLFEKKYPNNKAPRSCIETSRAFARGNATEKQRDAARAAARDAEQQWQTDRLWEYLTGACG